MKLGKDVTSRGVRIRKQPKKARPIRKNGKQRLKDLQETMRLVLAVLLEKTNSDLKEMSNLTGLSVPTLVKFINEKYTLRVQYRTVQMICLAAGFDITFSEFGNTYLVLADDKIKRKKR